MSPALSAVLTLILISVTLAAFGRGVWAPVLFVMALCVPVLAYADGIGSVVLDTAGGPLGIAVGIALTLASTFHVADKIAALVQRANIPTPVIPGHPKVVEGLAALEQASLHVFKDIVTPDLLKTLEDMLKTKSLAEIGTYLAANYGPKLLTDVKAQAGTLLGLELGLVFGGDAAVEQAAILRLGVAASHITTLASGLKLVVPGAA